MERYYPKESSTAQKMVTEVSKATQQCPWISEKKHYKLIMTSCFRWSLLDLQEFHSQVHDTFKC